MAFRKFAKKAGRQVRKALKKRYAPKGKVNYGKIVSDVRYLKSVLNPEKKTFQYTNTDQGIGQVAGNVSAYYAADITPLPSQGTTSITRNGNSIRLHSSYFKFQFQQQSATTSKIDFKVMVIKVNGNPWGSPGGLAIPAMFNPNSFILNGASNAGIIDYNSDRNTSTFSTFQILRTKYFTLPENQIASQTMIRNLSFGMKYKSHHVKFQADGSNTIQGGQIILLIVANNGNASTGTASTLSGTQSTAVNTGALLQQDITHYFYDN